MSKASEIGQKVRFERVRQGIGFRELARAAGIASSTLYDLESGKTRRVNVSTLEALADALRVPVQTLIVP